MKLKYKPALLPICIYYFFLLFSSTFMFPYYTLQLRTLGLSLDDAALVGGLCPILAFIFGPLLGYIGDKLGFKTVLILSFLLMGVTGGVLPYLPVYRTLSAQVGLVGFNSTSSSSPWQELVWVGQYGECQEQIPNLIQVDCEDGSWTGKVEGSSMCQGADAGQHANCEQEETCTTYCRESLAINSSLEVCGATFEGGKGSINSGDWSLTFWIYFCLRAVHTVFLNSTFNLSDAAATTKAKQEGSSFSIVLFFGVLSGLLAPLIVGYIVDHVNFKDPLIDCFTGVDITTDDYRVPFGIADLLFIGLIIFIFFLLEVEVEKSDQKLPFRQEFGWVANARVLAFFSLLFFFGVEWGTEQTFYYVYAKEELGATVSLIGIMGTANPVTSLIILPFVPVAIRRLGMVNCVVFGSLLQGMVMVCYGLIDPPEPPYILIAMASIQGIAFNVLWPAGIAYMTSVAPPALTGTAISLMATVTWVIGKAVGSLLSGLLNNLFGTRQMFLMVGGALCAAATIYWILYHTLLKRGEKKEEIGDKESRESREDEKTFDWLPSTHL